MSLTYSETKIKFSPSPSSISLTSSNNLEECDCILTIFNLSSFFSICGKSFLMAKEPPVELLFTKVGFVVTAAAFCVMAACIFVKDLRDKLLSSRRKVVVVPPSNLFFYYISFNFHLLHFILDHFCGQRLNSILSNKQMG